MSGSEGGGRKASVLQQILVAVAIAVLAGGTSPWWWNELKPLIAGSAQDGNGGGAPATPERPAVTERPMTTERPTTERPAVAERPATPERAPAGSTTYTALADAAADAERVQAWYLRGRNDGLECGVYRNVVEEIRKFVGNPRPLPADLVRTLRYAGTDPAATVSSLAVDRSRRIVSARSACF